MAELVWPSDIIPSEVEWKVVDSTAVFNSALSGATRTVSRPGLRWGCTMNFRALSGSDRHRVQAIIAGLRGRSNRIWLADESYTRRGTFASSELITNTTFATNSNWFVSAELTLSADSGKLRFTRTAVTTDRAFSANQMTTVANANYLYRFAMAAGRGNIRYTMRIGTTSGGLEIAAGSITTTDGLNHLVGTPTGTVAWASGVDHISGRAIDDFQILQSPSFARCALVNGASQTGSKLWIDGLTASTAGLLKAGDMIAVYTTRWELKRLTSDLDSNASGQGQVLFEPPLRSSPADNAPIAIHKPMGRFLLADEEVSWSSRPGVLSDFSVSFIEDLA